MRADILTESKYPVALAKYALGAQTAHDTAFTCQVTANSQPCLANEFNCKVWTRLEEEWERQLTKLPTSTTVPFSGSPFSDEILPKQLRKKRGQKLTFLFDWLGPLQKAMKRELSSLDTAPGWLRKRYKSLYEQKTANFLLKTIDNYISIQGSYSKLAIKNLTFPYS